MKRFLSVFLAMLLLLSSVAFAADPTATPLGPIPTDFTLSPKSLSVVAGDETHIYYVTGLGSAFEVTATSGNNDIATVSGTSNPVKVKGVAAGATTITLKLTDYPELTATCSVTVLAAPTLIIPGATAKTLEVGQTYQLNAAIGNGVNTKPFVYSSADSAIASVSATGLITAKSAGVVKITVATASGSAKADCTVTVKARPNINVGHNASSMLPGETMTFTAKDADDNVISGVSLGSSNASIISVSGSTLTAKAPGVAIITATYGGESATKSIVVKGDPTTVSVSPSPATVVLGKTVQLVPSVDENATTTYVYGASDVNPAGCFTISSSGLITASSSKTGTGKVTVTTKNGLSVIVNVTVVDKAPATTPTSSPTNTPTDLPLTPGSYPAQVQTANGGTLNLRGWKNDSATIYTTIPNGTWLVVTEKGSTWCKTSYNGIIGYVMTKFLSFSGGTPTGSPTGSPTSAPTTPPTPGEFDAKVTTKNGSLNLREKPTKDSRVLRTIPQNAWIVVTEKGSTWCKTTYNGTTGYVMTSFLTFGATPTGAPTGSPTSAPTSAPTTPPTPGEFDAKVTTKSGSLNLREKPTKDSRVLRTIPQNAWIVVTEKGSTWCKTTYNGTTGYVMTSFLTFGGTPTGTPIGTPTPAPVETLTPGTYPAQVLTANGGSLNLREDKTTDSKVLRQIPNRTKLTITAKGSTWCKTSYNGTVGYVMTKFLSFGAAPTSTPTAPPILGPQKAQVKTSGGYLNLRESASEVTKFVGRIPNGTELTVTERGAIWCKTSYNGETGYVRTSYLRFIGD